MASAMCGGLRQALKGRALSPVCAEDNEHIDAKEDGEYVQLPLEDGSIGLEDPLRDPALLHLAGGP